MNRDLAKKVLGSHIKNQKNVLIIEKAIYNATKEGKSDYSDIVYQVVGDLISGTKLSKVLESVKSGKVGWNHESFNTYIKKEDEKIDYIENPFKEVVDGAIECKCGSKRVFSLSKQTRSCDEPTTTIAICIVCSNKWTYSG